MKHKRKKVKNKLVICPYCGAQAILRPSSYLRGNPVAEHLYVCTRYPECDSYVSAHKSNLVPMGFPANAELRRKRHEAHQVFDQLWKTGIFTRSSAYSWLADVFFLKGRDAHIGSFDIEHCERLIKEATVILNNRRECQGRAV